MSHGYYVTHTDHKLLIFLFLSTCQDLEVQVCTFIICYNNRNNDDLEFTTLLLLHFSWGEREIFLIDALLRERQKSPCYDLHLVNQAYSCSLLHLHILLKCTCLVLWTPWPSCSITICAFKVSILSVLFKILLFTLTSGTLSQSYVLLLIIDIKHIYLFAYCLFTSPECNEFYLAFCSCLSQCLEIHLGRIQS